MTWRMSSSVISFGFRKRNLFINSSTTPALRTREDPILIGEGAIGRWKILRPPMKLADWRPAWLSCNMAKVLLSGLIILSPPTPCIISASVRKGFRSSSLGIESSWGSTMSRPRVRWSGTTWTLPVKTIPQSCFAHSEYNLKWWMLGGPPKSVARCSYIAA